MCRQILSIGLIIYCTVYYNLHRYRRISFWKKFLLSVDSFSENLMKEEHFPFQSSRRISFWKIHWHKELLLSVYSFSDNLMKEGYFLFSFLIFCHWLIIHDKCGKPGHFLQILGVKGIIIVWFTSTRGWGLSLTSCFRYK